MEAQRTFNKLVTKYCVMKDGKVYEPRGPGSYEIPEESLEKYNEEFKEFESIEVKVDKRKVSLKELEGVKLSPGELIAIEPIVHVLEEANE